MDYFDGPHEKGIIAIGLISILPIFRSIIHQILTDIKLISDK